VSDHVDCNGNRSFNVGVIADDVEWSSRLPNADCFRHNAMLFCDAI
jgi:hypothetical protein